jgi:hypothetical protein
MKVVCIDNRINRGIDKEELTLYKTYDIINEDVGTYYIRNDLGKFYDYNKTRFITLDEWRRIQLKKIL